MSAALVHDAPSVDMRAATWTALRTQAAAWREADALLAPWLEHVVLASDGLVQALARLLAGKLATPDIDRAAMGAPLAAAFAHAPALQDAVCRDLAAIVERDPSTDELLAGFLFHKGFQALQAHRAAHWHWHAGRKGLAAFLQNRVSEVFAVDIHPAARVGAGVFIDHATGVVIGETAVVGDEVSMLQEVTLGGTGKDKGDRHPKVGKGVLLCAGAKVLGNIQIGEGARIGAGSVVLHHVKPHTTVVGVPARATRASAAEPPRMVARLPAIIAPEAAHPLLQATAHAASHALPHAHSHLSAHAALPASVPRAHANAPHAYPLDPSFVR